MRRSTVLNGRVNQRDRAQQRGRNDSKSQVVSETSSAKMQSWLAESNVPSSLDEFEKLDLKEFLQSTGQIELPPEERLRQLAVFLEPIFNTPQPRTWLALDRIYEYATALAPNSLWVHHSRSISAKFYAESLPSAESKTFLRIMDAAWDAGNKALSIAPNEPEIHFLLGTLSYIDARNTLSESLGYFERAIAISPQHQWSHLYRAHCLHDMEQWDDAVSAYGDVNAAFFVGPLLWRYELLLEQKAYCRFRSGHINQAMIEFKMILERWIKNPGIGSGLMGCHTREVATGQLRSQLEPLFDQLTQHEDWSWLQSNSNNRVPTNPTAE